MTKIETRRENMTTGAREALNELDASLMQMFEVDSDTIPAEFRSKKDKTTFTFLANRLKKAATPDIDVNDVSVKFDSNKKIVEYTPQRLSTINRYRDTLDSDEGICYNNANEILQYKAEVDFCCKLVEWGVLGESDFETDD